MNCLLTLLLACMTLVPCKSIRFMEEPDDPAPDSVGVYDYSVLRRMGHPRVMMTSQDFDELNRALRHAKRDNPLLLRMHENAIYIADHALGSDDDPAYVRDASGRRILTQSRRALLKLYSCSYAYMTTGRKIYLEKVMALLEKVCSFPDWNPSHYLDTGEMSLAVSIAYDWLYHDLPYDLRVKVRKTLSDYVLRTAPEKSFHDAESNWNQVCNAGVVAAAIAVYEKDKSASWWTIEDGVRTNAKVINKIYGQDGNYHEGYGYWDYGTSFQVVLNQLLQTAFGSWEKLGAGPGFFNTARYMLYMSGTVGGVFPYADGGVQKESYNYGMWWFAANAQDPALLVNELRLLDSGKYGYGTGARLAPMVPCLLRNVRLDAPDKNTVPSPVWYGRGNAPVVMVHTSWTFDSEDRYLAIKGGKANLSHGHMDAGSFVYDALGVRWSEDWTRPSYAGIENAMKELGANYWSMTQRSLRWDILKMNNLGHSTISCMNTDGSVDKLHASDHLVKGNASLVEVYEGPDRLGACLDMTGVLSDALASARRSIYLLECGDLVVEDEITAKPDMDAMVQWRMVTRAAVDIVDDGEMLSLNGKTMTLRVQSSDTSVEPCYTVWPYERPAGWEPRSQWIDSAYGSIAGYTATIPAGTTVRLVTRLSCG